jgi:hypothetical protein
MSVNIEVRLNIGAEGGRWMEPAKDRAPCRALVLAVMNLSAHIHLIFGLNASCSLCLMVSLYLQSSVGLMDSK